MAKLSAHDPRTHHSRFVKHIHVNPRRHGAYGIVLKSPELPFRARSVCAAATAASAVDLSTDSTCLCTHMCIRAREGTHEVSCVARIAIYAESSCIDKSTELKNGIKIEPGRNDATDVIKLNFVNERRIAGLFSLGEMSLPVVPRLSIILEGVLFSVWSCVYRIFFFASQRVLCTRFV